MGYATADQCSSCSQQAKDSVQKTCGNSFGSRVYMKFCFLRFENHNFTGQLDPSKKDSYNDYNVSSDPNGFVLAARILLSSLSNDITSGSATNRYASGLTVDSGQFHEIYGLAQCWGDILLPVCSTCLSRTINNLFKDNAGRLGARGMSGNCIVQYESKPFFYPAPPPPENSSHAMPPQPPEKSSSKITIILGVFGGLLLLLIVCLFATRKRWTDTIFGRPNEGHYMGEDQQPIPCLSNVFTVFKMETLVAATENFHDNNKLGGGGFGAVYKGTSPDGSEIAVKKLSLKSSQGNKEFMNEIELVAKIQHRNLVKLLGCCAEGPERLLVYEYLTNNSLDKILFDPNKRRRLDWQKRYNIILGVTRGLLYLHEDSHLRIIHRDIKASNILLDKKFNAKIADFGLARLFLEDETHVSTRVAGTRGYMAPEYAMQGQLSVKADVYSFGVLLLELMSGRKNMDFNLSLELQILLKWAWGLYTQRNIVDIIDSAITETCNDKEQLFRCIQVGFLCTQAEASLRPTMSTVNMMLSTPFTMLPDPTKPAFVGSVPTRSSNIPKGFPSKADASITILVPR
jgi:hypothetical protein